MSDNFAYCSSVWNELELYSFVSDKEKRTDHTGPYRTIDKEWN